MQFFFSSKLSLNFAGLVGGWWHVYKHLQFSECAHLFIVYLIEIMVNLH